MRTREEHRFADQIPIAFFVDSLETEQCFRFAQRCWMGHGDTIIIKGRTTTRIFKKNHKRREGRRSIQYVEVELHVKRKTEGKKRKETLCVHA